MSSPEWRPRVHDAVARELQNAVVRLRRTVVHAEEDVRGYETRLREAKDAYEQADREYTQMLGFLRELGVEVPEGAQT